MQFCPDRKQDRLSLHLSHLSLQAELGLAPSAMQKFYCRRPSSPPYSFLLLCPLTLGRAMGMTCRKQCRQTIKNYNKREREGEGRERGKGRGSEARERWESGISCETATYAINFPKKSAQQKGTASFSIVQKGNNWNEASDWHVYTL